LPGITFFSGESTASLVTALTAWLQKTRREGVANQSVPTWQAAAEQLLSSLGLSGEPCCATDSDCAAKVFAQGVAV